MAFSDYLSIPFLVSLGITLLLVGFIGMFFTQRLQEQNHKINSMVSLVGAMADEVNYLRNIYSSIPSQVKNINLNGGSLNNEIGLTNDNSLIQVSDGEDDDDSEDNDSEDDDSESEDEDESSEIPELVDDTNFSNIKVINIHDNSDNFQPSIKEIEEIQDLNEEENDNISDSESESSESEESLNLVEIDTNTELNISLDNSIEKITNDDLNLIDYKKLSLNKLRSIVSEKGLSDDVNKLKKQDLIKLLES